jgi:hypothetical protein
VRLASILLLAALCLAGCDDATYTLYRNSIVDPNARYHVATFDAAEAEKYIQENCQLLKSYFRSSQELRRDFGVRGESSEGRCFLEQAEHKVKSNTGSNGSLGGK